MLPYFIFKNFLKDFIYLFLGRGEEREKERGRNIDVWDKQLVVSCMPLTGDLAHNADLCPDWESNQQPFGLQAGAQFTEPHQPGQDFLKKNVYFQICNLNLN